MAKNYDDKNTKITVDLKEYKGTKESNKDKTYTGVEIMIGDAKFVVFPYRGRQLEHVKTVLEANK